MTLIFHLIKKFYIPTKLLDIPAHLLFVHNITTILHIEIFVVIKQRIKDRFQCSDEKLFYHEPSKSKVVTKSAVFQGFDCKLQSTSTLMRYQRNFLQFLIYEDLKSHIISEHFVFSASRAPKFRIHYTTANNFVVKFETEKNALRIIDLHLYRLNLVVFRVVVNSNRIVFKLYNTSSMQFYCRCRRQLKVYNCKKWTQGQISYLCHGAAPVQNT